MASQCIRQEGQSSNADPLRFFRIVPQDDKIQLPRGFIKECGHSLPSRVTLKVPNGIPWEVELISSDVDTWIQKGWEEFKEYYSVGLRNVMLFEYDWISHFEVKIFDLSALEIKYPGHTETGRVANQERFESDDSLVFVNENLTRHNERGKGVILEENDDRSENDSENDSSFKSLDSRSARRVNRRNGPNDEDFIKEEVSSRAMKNARNIGSFQEGTSRKVNQTKGEVDKKRTGAAYKRAKAFRSENPFCIIQMTPTYIHRSFMYMPIAFARENLPCTRNDVKLRVSGGKTWCVSCNFKNSNKAIVVGRCTSFVRDNKLEVGDVIIVEVKNHNKLEWDVIIFRS